MMQLRSPVMLALDVDDFSKGLALVRSLGSDLGAVKVGPRLLIKKGAEIVQELAKHCPVFVDNKYYDIPNTMESAVRATFEAGATFVTVHASAGPEALARMASLQSEFRKQRPFQILCVTILTSFTAQGLPTGLRGQPIDTLVQGLAKDVLASGCDGLVCSPHEVKSLRGLSASAFLVTPGVRMEAVPGDDQARVMTPAQALHEGASALVIGRPLLQAADPVRYLQQVLTSL